MNPYFSEASVYPTFQSVTNPYMFATAQGIVIGTSGQNVADVLSNTEMEDPLDVMEQMIRWCHIAPTCPDTLGCFPYADGTDPFILDAPPKVFFAGNQEQLAHRKIQNVSESGETFETLLITLPSFRDKRQACLVNIASMECKEILFDTDFETLNRPQSELSPIPNK